MLNTFAGVAKVTENKLANAFVNYEVLHKHERYAMYGSEEQIYRSSEGR